MRRRNKSTDRLLTALNVFVLVGGILLLVYCMENTFSFQTYSIGGKSGPGWNGQGDPGAPDPGRTPPPPTPPPTPTPTPDKGLLENFNPYMTLENIAVWRGDNETGGKTSADSFLCAAVLPLCRLLDEVSFTPPDDEVPLRFSLSCNDGQTQRLTVYAGDIASFPELPDRFFQVPHIAAVGEGLLVSNAAFAALETPRDRLESAAILAYFSSGNSHVVLEQEVIRGVAAAFFDMEKEETEKPETLSAQREALVFFVYGRKYYVTRYDGYFEFYGDGVPRTWYQIGDDARAMMEALRNP